MTHSLHRLNSSSSCDSVLSKLVPPEKSFIDSILEYDNPEQAEIVLPDGQKFFWYFAIGSMANPITLYLHNLIPPMSYPATCLDHKVVFRATGGMPDVEACPGEKFDRVILLLINEQMIRLNEIELSHHRIKVNCIDYQNQSHIVYAYQMNNNVNQPISLLYERYLDIIIKVYEYYKVRPEYISVTYRFISL